MLAYIWNEYHVFPGDVFNLPHREKLFIYAATQKDIERREKENKQMAKKPAVRKKR
jgi:hypothetical protein